MDPSPFNERDLDPKAEEYIVSFAEEFPRDAILGLRVHLDRPAGDMDEAALLRDAINQYFGGRAYAERCRLRHLFRRGRISLLIGLAFLAAAIVAAEIIGETSRASGLGRVVSESVLIGGWVAMWRPLEIFLHAWWPIRARARLLERLAAMPVQLNYGTAESRDAWRRDWPAAVARTAG